MMAQILEPLPSKWFLEPGFNLFKIYLSIDKRNGYAGLIDTGAETKRCSISHTAFMNPNLFNVY